MSWWGRGKQRSTPVTLNEVKGLGEAVVLRPRFLAVLGMTGVSWWGRGKQRSTPVTLNEVKGLGEAVVPRPRFLAALGMTGVKLVGARQAALLSEGEQAAAGHTAHGSTGSP